jgi:hypothetical protein
MLQELTIDTSCTYSGIKFDDRALLLVTGGCPQLRRLCIKALLRFGDDGGSSLRSLRHLQELAVTDLWWMSVCHLLQLAAEAPRVDGRQQAFENVESMVIGVLNPYYLSVLAAGWWLSTALKGFSSLRAAALLGLTALAVPLVAELATVVVPPLQWKRARLCAAAVQQATQRPFALRPCWLPQSLQLLSLQDCEVCCHRQCERCRRRWDMYMQAGSQLQVQLVQTVQPDSLKGTHSCHGLQELCERSSQVVAACAAAAAGGGGSPAGHGLLSEAAHNNRRLRAAVNKAVKSDRKRGVLGPRLWVLIGKAALSPVVVLLLLQGLLWCG